MSFNPSSLQEVNQNCENLWRSVNSPTQRESSDPETEKKEALSGEQESQGKTFQELLAAQQMALEHNAMNGIGE